MTVTSARRGLWPPGAPGLLGSQDSGVLPRPARQAAPPRKLWGSEFQGSGLTSRGYGYVIYLYLGSDVEL